MLFPLVAAAALLKVRVAVGSNLTRLAASVEQQRGVGFLSVVFSGPDFTPRA